MLFTSLILAMSSSIDALGIGTTFGIRNTKVSVGAKFVIYFLILIISSIGVLIGSFISKFLSEKLTNFLGSSVLILMGIWIIYNSINRKPRKKEEKKLSGFKYNFFIKPLGITIQIIKNPISSDLDNSQNIDTKEAFYLAFALSLDALCIGIGSSIFGVNPFIFPIFVATMHILFLSIGTILGKKVTKLIHLPENVFTIISGSLLILIALFRIFL